MRGNIPKQIASQTIEKCLNKYEMFWNPPRSPCAIVGFSRRLLWDNTVACALENRMSLSTRNTGVCPFAYPELPECVDVLRFQKGIVVTVHQTFPMNHCCIVHQYSHVPNLLKKQKRFTIMMSLRDILCYFVYIFLILCRFIIQDISFPYTVWWQVGVFEPCSAFKPFLRSAALLIFLSTAQSINFSLYKFHYSLNGGLSCSLNLASGVLLL